STSPFSKVPARIRSSVAASMKMAPLAVASREVSGLPPTSTICARPSSSKCVSFDIRTAYTGWGMLGTMTRTILLVGMAGALLWAGGFGCGEDAPERRPDEVLAGGPPPRINLNVTGPDSDEGKREKCQRIARDNG